MAGWSMLANGPGLDSGNVVNHKQKGIIHGVKEVDVVNDCDADVELRNLFGQTLSLFHDVDNDREYIKPNQVLLGKGETVDLFKLFCVVGQRGGFDLVNGFWKFVAKELGLDPLFSGCIKLVYFKYLYNMERGLTRRCRDGQLGHSECERGTNFATFSLGLKMKLRSLLVDVNGKMGKDGRLASLEYKKSDKTIELDVGKGRLGMSRTPDLYRPVNGFQIRYNDDDDNAFEGCGNYVDNTVDPAMSHNYLVGKGSRKRKRVFLSKMLSWIGQVAASPTNGAIVSMSYDRKGNDLKALAIRARDFLLREIPADLSSVLYGSKDQLMYKDIETAQPGFRSGNTGMATSFKDGHIPVRVGFRFQVKVLKWTGEVYESDDKWLGTKVWPLDTGRTVLMKPIGKGRSGFCSCKVPGSVICVRFHTAEERMKLKLELGSAFFRSGFNHMGEEVSLGWTYEEEKRFKEMVIGNPPSHEKCFWDYAHIFLPGKTRRELVSYYFNVFQVQRRSYQNRATPDDIDSDDDEKQFGSFGDGFGRSAIKVHDMEEGTCSLNKQCNDYL